MRVVSADDRRCVIAVLDLWQLWHTTSQPCIARLRTTAEPAAPAMRRVPTELREGTVDFITAIMTMAMKTPTAPSPIYSGGGAASPPLLQRFLRAVWRPAVG